MEINWFISITIAVVALAIVVLVIFIILALLSLRKMLKDLDAKIRSLDPIFRVVHRTGHIIEKKAAQLKRFSDEAQGEMRSFKKGPVNIAMQVAELALLSMAIWQKMRQKKWR